MRFLCLALPRLTLLCGCALGLMVAAAQAAAPPVPAAHPLLGMWRASTPTAKETDKGSTFTSCEETLDYRASHVRLGTSGKEITRATFTVSEVPATTGFYTLTETFLASNGNPDCAGDLHGPSDDTPTRFVQFSPRRDQFIVCKAASLTACFGPFKRQP